MQTCSNRSTSTLLEHALRKRLLPAVVLEDVELALPLGEALLAGGLDVIEFTFRTAAAEEAIRRMVRHLPEMVVGAGTLLTVEQVARARDAGATFGMAPGLDADVVRKTQECGLGMLPGVVTSSEISAALALGCKVLKFFPAEASGGVKAVEALSGAFCHVGARFVPTGGIHPQNMRSYLALPSVAAVGGSWMVAKSLIATKNWKQIETLAREAVALARAEQG